MQRRRDVSPDKRSLMPAWRRVHRGGSPGALLQRCRSGRQAGQGRGASRADRRHQHLLGARAARIAPSPDTARRTRGASKKTMGPNTVSRSLVPAMWRVAFCRSIR